MNIYIATILALFTLVTPAYAQEIVPNWYGGEYKKCNEQYDREILECNQKFINKWDARLNKAYKKLTTNKDNPRTKNLIKTQKLWIKYRDANCHYYTDQEGTIGRIEYSECMRIMTARRALELEQEGREY